MADTYNIFISWSGERSEKVAKALYDWLPTVLQTARPWMSKEDIEKGSRALEEIGKALEELSLGIICLTPENAEKPWIHFEAGALSKRVGEKTRVCPYLFGGLRGEQVKLPLGIFQAARAEKEETRKMVLSVNKALGGVVDGARVDTWFERGWPDLEKKLTAIQAAKEAPAPRADERKMIVQVLELAEAAVSNNAKLREDLRGVREVLDRLVGAQMELRFPSGGAGIGNRSTRAIDGILGVAPWALPSWMDPGLVGGESVAAQFNRMGAGLAEAEGGSNAVRFLQEALKAAQEEMRKKEGKGEKAVDEKK